MIDEELYKRAIEELDSEARKPDVWTRACALASDDHDEARFLYTNLRVEEMLSKNGKRRTFSADRHRRQGSQGVEALGLTELNTKPSSTGDDLDDTASIKHTAEPESTVGVNTADIIRESAQNQKTSETINSDATVAADQPNMTPKQAAQTVPKNTHLAGSIAHDMRVPASPKQEPTQIDSDVVSEVPVLSNAIEPSSSVTPEQKRTSELTQKLEQQAQNLSIEQQDDNDFTATIEADAFEPSTLEPSVQPNLMRSEAHHSHLQNNQTSESAIANQTSVDHPEPVAAKPEPSNLGTRLDYGLGTSYSMFERNGAVKAVKKGVSWPALFFTFPWLLSKAMIGTAIVYGLLAAVTLISLYVTGTAWLDAGAQATTGIKLWTGAFAAIALIGLLYLPFRYGNDWVAHKLKKRGFEFTSSVSASSKSDAHRRLIDATPM